MVSTVSKRIFSAVVLLVSIVGLATATFEGSSSCGIHIHRDSGNVLWCEAQGQIITGQNTTIYVAQMNATNNRVAIFSSLTSGFLTGGTSTTAQPYLDTDSGRFMITVSTISSAGIAMPSVSQGFHILSGSIQDAKNLATVYWNSTATELIDTAAWVNGVFLFATTTGENTAKNISYKAFTLANNALSFVEIFTYSAITKTQVQTWTLDGSARLCLSLQTDDQSSIVCKGLTNSSAELVIHTDSNSVTFATLVSDNNGRIFWGEVNGTNSWRVWAANSDKSDTAAVIDRTTNETHVVLQGLAATFIAFGYDSYNKLVYWTEQIPLSALDEYTFGVFGWDGKTNAVVTYFAAANVSTTVGQICTFNGQMMLTSTVGAGGLLQLDTNVTRHLYHTSPSSSGSPASVLLFTHIFQDISGSLSLVCDDKTGWAVAAFSDLASQIGSDISAIRIDNTTTVSIKFSADVNITLGVGSTTLTDGVVGYTLGNTLLGIYDLFFYSLPIADEVIAVPSDGSNNSPSSPNTNPSTSPVNNGPSGNVSFANQIVPLMYIASLAYLFF